MPSTAPSTSKKTIVGCFAILGIGLALVTVVAALVVGLDRVDDGNPVGWWLFGIAQLAIVAMIVICIRAWKSKQRVDGHDDRLLKGWTWSPLPIWLKIVASAFVFLIAILLASRARLPRVWIIPAPGQASRTTGVLLPARVGGGRGSTSWGVLRTSAGSVLKLSCAPDWVVNCVPGVIYRANIGRGVVLNYFSTSDDDRRPKVILSMSTVSDGLPILSADKQLRDLQSRLARVQRQRNRPNFGYALPVGLVLIEFVVLFLRRTPVQVASSSPLPTQS